MLKHAGACQISNTNNTLLRKLNIKLVQVQLYNACHSEIFFLCAIIKYDFCMCSLYKQVKNVTVTVSCSA